MMPNPDVQGSQDSWDASTLPWGSQPETTSVADHGHTVADHGHTAVSGEDAEATKPENENIGVEEKPKPPQQQEKTGKSKLKSVEANTKVIKKPSIKKKPAREVRANAADS